MAAGRCTIARSAISNTGVRYEVLMGDTKKPSAQRGESVTTRVSESDAKSDGTEDSGDDLQALIEQAEAEAAEAEAAAAAARARVRALRSDDDDAATEAVQARPWYRRVPRRSTVAKAVAALVIVGCLIASGVVVWRHHTASEQRQRSEQFSRGRSRRHRRADLAELQPRQGRRAAHHRQLHRILPRRLPS